MKKELLRIHNGQVQLNIYESLKNIHLNLLESEVLGIIFANMYEKKAFLKVMKGECTLSVGRVYIFEKNVVNSHELCKSIYVIDKESKLNKYMSIHDNIYYSFLSPFLWQTNRYSSELQQVLQEFGLSINITQSVQNLSNTQRFCLELVKAYVLNRKIVVLADLSVQISLTGFPTTLCTIPPQRTPSPA